MDKSTQKAKRQAFSAIIMAVMIFASVIAGLVIMGIKSINVTTERVLRSELAQKLRNRETFDCTASWAPVDADEFADAGSLPNPSKMSVTLALSDNGNKLYLDRFYDGEKYMSFYSDGKNMYIWSAMEHLWLSGQLRNEERGLPVLPNIKATNEEFYAENPGFFNELDQMIRDFPAGTEIVCDIGGTFGYSQPKDKENWITPEDIKARKKQEEANETSE